MKPRILIAVMATLAATLPSVAVAADVGRAAVTVAQATPTPAEAAPAQPAAPEPPRAVEAAPPAAEPAPVTPPPATAEPAPATPPPATAEPTPPATPAPTPPVVAGPGPRREGDDMVIGAADAPVTIIEYASLTCPHCANFHANTLPKLKSEYIDKGRVKLIYRDFPLDRLALNAAQLPHCVAPERYFALLDVLYRQQLSWARASDPKQALTLIGRQAGMSGEAIEACFANQAVMTAVLNNSLRGEREHKVSSTPTLVINGKVHTGSMTFEELDKVLKPLAPARS